jgi:hypothetical protein
MQIIPHIFLSFFIYTSRRAGDLFHPFRAAARTVPFYAYIIA